MRFSGYPQSYPQLGATLTRTQVCSLGIGAACVSAGGRWPARLAGLAKINVAQLTARLRRDETTRKPLFTYPSMQAHTEIVCLRNFRQSFYNASTKQRTCLHE